ncbi:HAD family hydrolase [bacterium]|nr:HAD family hydrolase [bacterium]
MKLILFDIDGTLVLTGGAGSRSMTKAFSTVFGVDNAFQEVAMPGMTDPLIFEKAIKLHGLTWTEVDLARFKQLYFANLEREIVKPNPGKKVMPGMPALLELLDQEKTMVVGLLTGNWRQGAYIKLDHFGIWSYFRCGAFSDDHKLRKKLVTIAWRQCEQMIGQRISAKDIWIIGDTPLDIACARDNGAVAVAVATGTYSPSQLQAHKPDYCYDHLADFSDLLCALRNE